jgi:hypothetical protein
VETGRPEFPSKGEGGLNSPTVKCYSGHTYAQEPRSFTHEGVEHEVVTIEKAWREPGGSCFLVKTGDNKFFQLCYNEAEGRWSVKEVARR